MNNNVEKPQMHIFNNAKDISGKKKVGLMSILEQQINKFTIRKMRKYAFSPMNERPNYYLKPQSQLNRLTRTSSQFTNQNKLTISKVINYPSIKQIKQERLQLIRSQSCLKNRIYCIDKSINNTNNILISNKHKDNRVMRKKILFNQPRSQPQSQTTLQINNLLLLNRQKLTKESQDKCINNNIKESNKKHSELNESKGCLIDYCFQTIKNEALAFSQTVYCSFEKVIDINGFSVFGLFDGYGKGGKVIARHLKNYFKKYILTRSNYSLTTNSSIEVLQLLTRDDYQFIRKIFLQYSSLVVDLPAYARCKESGVSLFIAFVIRDKLIYLSLGDMKAYLTLRRIISEREHMIINSICSEYHSKDEQVDWDMQIVNLSINSVDVNNNSQAMIVGTNSLLNQYATVNTFFQHINVTINKDSVPSIVSDLITMQKNKLNYLNESINDGGLGLIVFNN